MGCTEGLGEANKYIRFPAGSGDKRWGKEAEAFTRALQQSPSWPVSTSFSRKAYLGRFKEDVAANCATVVLVGVVLPGRALHGGALPHFGCGRDRPEE